MQDKEIELGPCCICRKTGDDVRNLLSLHYRAPVPGTGWGCVVCHLPSDGAVAVLCDACLEELRAGTMQIQDVCQGYPGEGNRVSYAELAASSEDFKHDMRFHPPEPTSRPRRKKWMWRQ